MVKPSSFPAPVCEVCDLGLRVSGEVRVDLHLSCISCFSCCCENIPGLNLREDGLIWAHSLAILPIMVARADATTTQHFQSGSREGCRSGLSSLNPFIQSRTEYSTCI